MPSSKIIHDQLCLLPRYSSFVIRLCTELDLLPNFEWFPWNICDGCGMPTGHAYSSGHLVTSLWDLHMFYLLRPILFRTCRYFTGLCSSNIPRYFLDFAYTFPVRMPQWRLCGHFPTFTFKMSIALSTFVLRLSLELSLRLRWRQTESAHVTVIGASFMENA